MTSMIVMLESTKVMQGGMDDVAGGVILKKSTQLSHQLHTTVRASRMISPFDLCTTKLSSCALTKLYKKRNE